MSFTGAAEFLHARRYGRASAVLYVKGACCYPSCKDYRHTLCARQSV